MQSSQTEEIRRKENRGKQGGLKMKDRRRQRIRRDREMRNNPMSKTNRKFQALVFIKVTSFCKGHGYKGESVKRKLEERGS